MSGWQPIETAPMPETGEWVVAVVAARAEDDRHAYLAGRAFVVRHMGYTDNMGLDLGWALFPGMGVGTEWFSHWMPLPAPPVQP